MSTVLRFAIFFALSWAAVLRRGPSTPNVDLGKRMEESENVEDPQNHGDDYDAIQNGLDGSLHGYEAIHQPKKYAHHDQYQ